MSSVAAVESTAKKTRGLVLASRAPDRVFTVALGAGLLTLVMLYSALFYWSGRVDAISRERELQLVDNGLADQIKEIEDSLTAVTQWDDAVANMDTRFDREWVDTNIGVFIDQSLHMDAAVVIDPHNAPVYAMRGGHEVPAAALPRLLSVAAPLVVHVRRQETARGPLRRPDNAASEVVSTPIRASSAEILDGQPYILTATLVQPDFGMATPKGPRSSIVLSAVRFDSAFERLSAHYMLGAPQLHAGARAAAPGQVRTFLTNPAGRRVATLVWSPQRPGRRLLLAALPAVTMASVILGLGALLAVDALRRNLRSLRRTMDALVEARDAAEVANQAKSQFLAVMGHEIRTPLNGVLGMVQIMQMSEEDPERTERLAVIRSSGESLLAILNDLLDLAKIEAGKVELELAPFDLVEMASGACGAFTSIAAAKGLALRLNIAQEARAQWLGDGVRLRQILYNLVSNAVKFTEQGEIAVDITARGPDHARRLEMRVSDTGMGVPPDKLAGLFQKFVQADSSYSRRFGGSGLGLAISQDLARMMGGEVRVQSVVGRGSTFWVDVPLKRLASQLPAPKRQSACGVVEDARSLRILAAEDNPTNQVVLKTVLAALGYEATIVADGMRAVEAWQAGEYDLVLMDVQMPGLDGLAATRRIRALENPRGDRVWIIALSANAMKHQVAEYMAAGMDGYLPKPIEVQRLFEVLQALEQGEAPSLEATGAKVRTA